MSRSGAGWLPIGGAIALRSSRIISRCSSWLDVRAYHAVAVAAALDIGQARRRACISRRMSGVKISCIASSIFPPGTTMMFGRDMKESCSIDSR